MQKASANLPQNIQVSILLNRIADALNERFGPHPTVPMVQLKAINEEIVNASEFDSKGTLLAAINEAAENSYRKAGLPLE